MLISWKHKFLFIHIAKTGGTALTQALAPYARFKDRVAYMGGASPVMRRGLSLFFGGPKYIENITGFNVHSSYRYMQMTLGHETVAPLTKAAFVRNPFTRTVSMFHHIKRSISHPNHDRIRDLTFEQALPLMCELEWTIQTKYLFRLGAKEIVVDFIGAYERLEEDSAALAERLHLPAPLRLKHVNANPGPAPNVKETFGNQLQYFIDANEEEFELLGYSRDVNRASEPPRQPISR